MQTLLQEKIKQEFNSLSEEVKKEMFSWIDNEVNAKIAHIIGEYPNVNPIILVDAMAVSFTKIRHQIYNAVKAKTPTIIIP